MVFVNLLAFNGLQPTYCMNIFLCANLPSLPASMSETLDCHLILAASEATPPLGPWSDNEEGDVRLASWRKTTDPRWPNKQDRFGVYHPRNSHIYLRGSLERNGQDPLLYLAISRGEVTPRKCLRFPAVGGRESLDLTLEDVGALRARVLRASEDVLRLELFRDCASPIEGALYFVPRVHLVTPGTPYHCRGFELPLDRLPVYTG